ncbi:hypothetical protein PN836_016940 [Ningiella sp. W23]|uniref:hypothetical protein n=1 Tax=Ningiella sp. W23 TaxID=3023715 RepID=UPI003756B60A
MLKLAWFAASLLLVGFSSYAQEVRLVGNKVETFINDRNQSSRLTDLVEAALGDIEHSITATTQAWSGSGLRNGQYNGYIDHYSLNDFDQNYIYSSPYVTLDLHVASTDANAQEISKLDELYRERVGLETRFANTDQVRSQRTVKWARAQDFFSNIEQLAEQRVNYVVADLIMLQEMNKMLIAIDQEPLYISQNPILRVDVSLAMHTRFDQAQQTIDAFENGIEQLRTSGELASIYVPASGAQSTLDQALYRDILKRW